VHSARFAPDAKTVIYGAAFEGRPLALFSTRTDGFESRPFDLPSTDIAGMSRDGQMALLLGRHNDASWLRVGTLAQVALAGGAPREILENVFDADISPDGTQFAVVVADGDDQVLQYPIGKEIFRSRGWISQPRIAPNGKRIAFVNHRVKGDDLGEVELAEANGKIALLGKEQQYTQGVCWSPDGSEVWFTIGDDIGGGTLFRVSPGGTPRIVLRAPSLIRIQDVAVDGRVLLMTDETRATLAGQLAGDTSERVYSWWDNDSAGGISSDGSSYAGDTASVVIDGEYAVFFRRGDSTPVQLGMGLAAGMTPDGKFVFTARLTKDRSTLTMRPVGPGQPRTIDLGGVTPDVNGGQHLTCSSDGRRVAFVGTKPDTGRAVYVMDVDGGAPHAASPEGASTAVISPDGSKIAVADPKLGLYVASATGRLPVPGAPPREAPLAWSPDGRSVLSWDTTLPPRIYRTNLDTGQRELVRELIPPDPAGIIYGWLTMSPDGRFYLQRYRRALSTVYFVTLD
jgi:Tol biopolymer transport system component